ncbi:MAG: hypothetical protein ACRC1H_11800 [Caldilineaceae bacterium]
MSGKRRDGSKAGGGGGGSAAGGEFLFYTAVDDDLYAELTTLVGQKLVFAGVWEDSLAEALEARASGRPLPEESDEEIEDGPTCDIDLYLEDGVYFELYSVAVYESLDAEPLPNRETIEAALHDLLRGNASLGDVAVDDDEALVLVLHRGPKPDLYLAVGGWVLEEWDELPV